MAVIRRETDTKCVYKIQPGSPDGLIVLYLIDSFLIEHRRRR